jgi:hypothetical protein
MAIKAGQILHAMNTFIVDRIQTAGGNLNIPTERIYELGNYQSVAIIRDVPDLTFNLECLDVDCEVESLLTGSQDPQGAGEPLGTDGATGTRYTIGTNFPVDIVSPMKSAQGAFDIVRGVATPHLALESVNYRYGLRDNAGETFNLRGDSIFYIPGVPYVTRQNGDGAQTAFPFNDDRAGVQPAPATALIYTEQGNDLYALNVSVDGVRQRLGDDYTETDAGITFNTPPANNARVRIVFGSATPATYPQTVHQGISGVGAKPAAIRGKDIQVFVGDTVGDGSGVPLRWSDVQSFNLDWRVTMEDDYEFGNPRAVSREATDAPEVSGSIELRPLSAQALFTKLNHITGVDPADIVGPQSSRTLPLEIRLHNPESGGTDAVDPGTVLKTLYVPDARFQIPGYEGRVQQKMNNTINFESDTGLLEVYRGRRF